jgi:hypothetical protein
MEGGLARHVHTAPPRLLDDTARPELEAPPLALNDGHGQDVEDRDQRSPRNSILVKQNKGDDSSDGDKRPRAGARQARQSQRHYYPTISRHSITPLTDGDGRGLHSSTFQVKLSR